MHRLLALAAAAALVLGGCSGAVGGASGSSVAGGSPTPAVTPAGPPPRVIGTVTAGPVCPVEPASPDPRCAPRPVAGAVIVATDASGQEVGRATSAADGTYQLNVAQTGPVVITAQPVTGLMRAPQPVDVTLTSPGQVERVNLEYDTGIR